MVILDTCALIFDALTPEQLSQAANVAIMQAETDNEIYCCDISLWEIAMLVQKKRLDPGTDVKNFLELTLQARQLKVLSITPDIAALSISTEIFKHHDPADRIIAATTLHHRASLVTCDKKLADISTLVTVW